MYKRHILILLLFTNLVLFAQKKVSDLGVYGVPYMTHYNPKDIKIHRQNWSIIQDDRGIIYVGNSNGLLTFDGTTWKHYYPPNKTAIRALGKDTDGRIYYGAQGDFGYLANDQAGNLLFVSLLSNLPDTKQQIKDVWSIQMIKNQIFIQTLNTIVSFQSKEIAGNKVNIIVQFETKNSSGEINGLSSIEDNAYFWVLGKGLMQNKNKVPVLIPDGQQFHDKEVIEVVPFSDDKKLLIATLSNGLFIHDGSLVKKYKVSNRLKKLFIKNRILDIERLSDGTIALSTSKSGLIIMNKQGQVVQTIDESVGLPSNNVLSSFVDRQGSLWLATARGISRIETPSPIQRFFIEPDVEVSINDFEVHKDKLFMATKLGVYQMLTDSLPYRFKKLANVTDNAFSIESTNDGLMAAFPYLGVIEFDENKFNTVVGKQLPVKVKASRFDPNIVYIGSGGNKYGFAILYKLEKGWKPLYVFPKVKDQIREIQEEAPGVIWLGTRNNGYLRLEIPELQTGTLNSTAIENIDTLYVNQQRYTKKGGTTVFRSRLYHINNKIEFATTLGLRKIDSVNQQLALDDRLHSILADTTKTVYIIREALDKSLWVYTNATKNNIVKLRPEGSKYLWQELPELNRTIGTTITDIFASTESSELLFIGTPNGFITFNSNVERPINTSYNALIREVLIEDDSLVYNGDWLHRKRNRSPDTYNFSQKAISFSYAATSYDLPEKTAYQYALQGYDDTWSTWTTKNKKEYTNLPGGDYIFKVKAKNIYGIESEVGTFSFSIKPPWYLSIMAYIAYTIALMLSFLLLLRIRLNQVRKKQRVEMTQLENKYLKKEIEYKKKDLSDFAVTISQNQKWADYLLDRVQEIKAAKGRTKGKQIELLEQEIKDKTAIEKNKLDFQKRIDLLNNSFYDTLVKKYPDLTKTEIKLCSLIKLNLDNKDIAILQNVTLRSVYKARTRLRKKLKLDSDTDLVAFLKQF
ncbi:MAG: triple tyrosine motif-containing protein [Bacteroidota bacterium]